MSFKVCLNRYAKTVVVGCLKIRTESNLLEGFTLYSTDTKFLRSVAHSHSQTYSRSALKKGQAFNGSFKNTADSEAKLCHFSHTGR